MKCLKNNIFNFDGERSQKVSKCWKWVWKYTRDREHDKITDSMVFLYVDFINEGDMDDIWVG
jgi:hypothetical protein